MSNSIKNIWREKFSISDFKRKFILSVLIIAVVLFILTQFLQYNEKREGFAFDDPFLILFDPINLTWITFTLIYAALLTAIIYLLKHPDYLLIAIQTYTLTVIIRMIVMYSLPLNPPESMIPLIDPFVEFFGGGETLRKDLFFSGHTSTMFILYLTAKNKRVKVIFLAATLLVALAVVLQHVHYTVDVLAAPFFAFTCFSIIRSFNNINDRK